MPFLKGFIPGLLSIIISAGYNSLFFYIAIITTTLLVTVVAIKLSYVLKQMRVHKHDDPELEKFTKDYLEKNKDSFSLNLLISLTYINVALLIASSVNRIFFS